MAGKNTAVFGIYRSRAGAEEAVDALRAAGFRNADVSVLLPENQGTKDLGVTTFRRRSICQPNKVDSAPAERGRPNIGRDPRSGRWL